MLMEGKIGRQNSEAENEKKLEICPEIVTNTRYGGAQSEDDDTEATKKAAEERARKKAEVRKRLEEANRAKKAKKGFLTPERKKKLRKLLMMKAAEDLKQQQMLKEQERQRVLQERILPLPDLDNVPDEDLANFGHRGTILICLEELEEIAKKMAEKLLQLESEHYDINYTVRQKDFEINELTISVNDLRGKFVKPTLKKVSKTDNRFNKLKKKDRNFVDFRTNLKNVESNKFTLKEVNHFKIPKFCTLSR
ncbi:troponin I 4 [Wuchereria bancrofti]|uniref:Troponin I 4 n=1 Tax=Wuchereria bancrofti TaxID=6293 RepID=J9ET33_WUCBA|nr:troponin I 4 [Wuchereria bancrofti]